ncbi:MAG: gamma-glutamyl-gamma-aminobutyrate hydrolase family protein [Candidatus Riflebacteria bacterium]|nr:gamma-glutamyl-gamma-aminobutyrate hydrolase family protein [Candidatus Riflebacteria bacterium]
MHRKMIPILILCNFLIASHVFADSRPLIGISPSFSNNSIQLNNDYVTAINENGGIAIILPPTASEEIIEEYIKMLDGAVFSGGPDIPPDFYGQIQHATTQTMEPTRFEFEKQFIKAFLASGKPVLGICLGMQFSNVVSGGTMIQDIPTMIGKKVSHRNGEMYTNFHQIGIARGSLLANILKKTSTAVISRHHQAVEKVANCFTVVARSTDGIVEALERNDGPFGIFVQWHPESLKDADPHHRNDLFKALVDACQNVKATRGIR